MIAIPAIFYDIIAPLAVTVVLFLMGFQQKEKNDTEPEASKTATERPPRREKQTPPPAPTAVPEPPKRPDLKELLIYIDSALQDDFSLLPDDAIGNIEERQCKKFREYLTTFIYKEKNIITEKDNRYISIFDKHNLKRFMELQYNVQRKGE